MAERGGAENPYVCVRLLLTRLQGSAWYQDSDTRSSHTPLTAYESIGWTECVGGCEPEPRKLQHPSDDVMSKARRRRNMEGIKSFYTTSPSA